MLKFKFEWERIMPEQQVLFHTQEIEKGPAEPFGVPLYSKGNLVCELCSGLVAVLTPIDFKNMFWIQRNSIQDISKNSLVKRFDLELCDRCHKKIFDYSKVTINFSKDLFEALKRSAK